MQDLRPVYDAIASAWNVFRTNPLPEVKEFVKTFRTKQWFIDLGCGSGRNFPALKKYKFVAIDFSKQMALLAKQKHDLVIVADLQALPFKNDSFKGALMISVMNHFKKPPWKEVKRVLKKKSRSLVMAWNPEQPRFSEYPGKKVFYVGWKHEGKVYKRYYHLFSLKELKTQLKNEGFAVLKSFHNQKFAKNLSLEITKKKQ
ncbi:MAG: class I SAM-dependent methyltransferase [Nanoarchaeota archaeon]|nr:class I SAM-dependent methyltransferase [Nanoarchaeota archaeon]